MSATELERSARLDAIAAVRAILSDDTEAVRHLVEDNPQPGPMAHAACGFAASLLALHPAATRQRILDQLTEAAINE